jgi:hypothetical protein
LQRNLWGEAARHVVWLMNRVSTKAVEGKTPHEAVFGNKPNLQDIREWGEKVLIWVEEGNKLEGHVQPGRWIGMDAQSKGMHVYWLDKRTVTVEQNIYYLPQNLSVSRNEGEDDHPAVPQTNIPIKINPSTSSRPSNSQMKPSDEIEETCAKCIRKPTQRVTDILEGCVESSLRRSQHLLARGIQLPTVTEESVDVEGE